MLLTVAADERAAMQFDDLASAFDAGLPVASLGGDAAAGDRVVHGILARRGVQLRPTEDAVLTAAWRVGRISASLRQRAELRRERAAAARTVWQGLRYPLLLLVFLCIASCFVGAVLGSYFLPALALGSVAALTVFAVVAIRGLRSGSEAWRRVPVLGRFAQDFGELPYLETLHAMYASGVPLLEAHRAAVATVSVESVAARLRIATGVVAAGRPLAEALQESLALHAESRTLLSNGERAGQLEEAARRALQRRRETVTRTAADLARWVGVGSYSVAVVLAVVYIAWIYATTIGKALSLGH